MIEEVGDTRQYILNYSQYANVLHSRGDIENAFKYQEKALELASQFNNRDGICSILSNLAYYRLTEGDIQQAKSNYLEAKSISRDTGDNPAEANASASVANIYYGEGNFDLAFSNYQNAIKLHEAMRYPLIVSTHRANVMRFDENFYRRAIWSGIETSHIKEFFEFLELSKSRWLSDQLLRRSLLSPDHPLYKEYIRAYDQLDLAYAVSTSKTSGWDTTPFSIIDDSNEGSLEEVSVDQAWSDFREVLKNVNISLDQGILANNTLSEFSDRSISECLPKNCAFVEFSIGKNSTEAFIILSNHKGVIALDIPNMSQGYLDFLLGSRYGKVSSSYWMSAYQNMQDDKEDWLATIENVVDDIGAAVWSAIDLTLENYSIKRVIFAPQGPLHLLPLHAASIPSGKVALEKYAIAYCPSGLIYKQIRNQKLI